MPLQSFDFTFLDAAQFSMMMQRFSWMPLQFLDAISTLADAISNLGARSILDVRTILFLDARIILLEATSILLDVTSLLQYARTILINANSVPLDAIPFSWMPLLSYLLLLQWMRSRRSSVTE